MQRSLSVVASLLAFGIPTAVGLTLVALIGYVVGKWGRKKPASDTPSLNELNQAQQVVRELERIATEVRKNLANHHSDVVAFRDRMDELATSGEQVDWKQLADEANDLLQPTRSFASQIAIAYDAIRRQSSQLEHFSKLRTDVVTKIGNRKCLDETLETMLGMNRRFGSIFSIAVFDIDHFKDINDELGRESGDELLQLMAETLSSCVRGTDIVARFEGAEFVVVLPGTDLVGAKRCGERIRKAIAERMKITVSGGVTMVMSRDSARAMLNRADAAMYASKAAGRDRVFEHDGVNTRCATGEDMGPFAATLNLRNIPTLHTERSAATASLR
jgi:diguanylate cyclase (GGDEF)-like protein